MDDLRAKYREELYGPIRDSIMKLLEDADEDVNVKECINVDQLLKEEEIAMNSVEQNGLPWLMEVLLCELPKSLGKINASAFGSCDCEERKFYSNKSIQGVNALTLSASGIGMAQAAKGGTSESLLDFDCRNVRTDCDITAEMLEQCRKEQRRWGCRHAVLVEAQITAILIDFHSRFCIEAGVFPYAWDNGGTTTGTDMVMIEVKKRRNCGAMVRHLTHVQHFSSGEHDAEGKVRFLSDFCEELSERLGITLEGNFYDYFMEKFEFSGRGGGPMTQETKDKISRALKDRLVNEESKRALEGNQNAKGKWGPMKQETKDKISESLKGTHHDEWEEEEHRRFLKGLSMYGWGEWKKIARIVNTTKNNIKCASHAKNSKKKDEWKIQYPKR